MAEFGLGRLGQVALAVADVDASEAFYRDVLGLRHLYRFGGVTFFDCQGVRLMIEAAGEEGPRRNSPLYFTVADIALAVAALEGRGARFIDRPHLIARMADHDLWMTFIADPDANLVGLMMEAPKGYAPPASG